MHHSLETAGVRLPGQVSTNGQMDFAYGSVIDDSACPAQPTTLVWLGGAYPGDLPGGITVSADVNVGTRPSPTEVPPRHPGPGLRVSAGGTKDARPCA